MGKGRLGALGLGESAPRRPTSDQARGPFGLGLGKVEPLLILFCIYIFCMISPAASVLEPSPQRPKINAALKFVPANSTILVAKTSPNARLRCMFRNGTVAVARWLQLESVRRRNAASHRQHRQRQQLQPDWCVGACQCAEAERGSGTQHLGVPRSGVRPTARANNSTGASTLDAQSIAST